MRNGRRAPRRVSGKGRSTGAVSATAGSGRGRPQGEGAGEGGRSRNRSRNSHHHHHVHHHHHHHQPRQRQVSNVLCVPFLVACVVGLAKGLCAMSSSCWGLNDGNEPYTAHLEKAFFKEHARTLLIAGFLNSTRQTQGSQTL